jgi:hypothetical protein
MCSDLLRIPTASQELMCRSPVGRTSESRSKLDWIWIPLLPRPRWMKRHQSSFNNLLVVLSSERFPARIFSMDESTVLASLKRGRSPPPNTEADSISENDHGETQAGGPFLNLAGKFCFSPCVPSSLIFTQPFCRTHSPNADLSLGSACQTSSSCNQRLGTKASLHYFSQSAMLGGFQSRRPHERGSLLR